MFTISEENYIKGIYHLQGENEAVTTNKLAERLQTKAASVTDMLKKLQTKKLLQYQPYYGVLLTKEGLALALEVIRRHRLWEYFLVHHLQFGWDEVHEIAEQLEHVQSQPLTNKLDAFLQYPRFDPHGDPIPDSKGKMQAQQQINLTHWPLGKMAEICAVGNQQTDLLELLRKKNLEIGTHIQITQRFSFDNSLEITIGQQPPFSISEQLAQQIFVKK